MDGDPVLAASLQNAVFEGAISTQLCDLGISLELVTDGHAEAILFAVIAVLGSLAEAAQDCDIVLVEKNAILVELWVHGQVCAEQGLSL